MAEKPLAWAGSSFKDLTDDNIFSLEARKVAGKQLRKVQCGDEPDDWKPFDEVGAGTPQDKDLAKQRYKAVIQERSKP